MTCQHELQFCSHCDNVTCKKCHKVWVYTPSPNVPYTVTVSGTGSQTG